MVLGIYLETSLKRIIRTHILPFSQLCTHVYYLQSLDVVSVGVSVDLRGKREH